MTTINISSYILQKSSNEMLILGFFYEARGRMLYQKEAEFVDDLGLFLFIFWLMDFIGFLEAFLWGIFDLFKVFSEY